MYSNHVYIFVVKFPFQMKELELLGKNGWIKVWGRKHKMGISRTLFFVTENKETKKQKKRKTNGCNKKACCTSEKDPTGQGKDVIISATNKKQSMQLIETYRLSESPWFHNDFQKTNKKNVSLLKIAASPNTDSENWEIKGKELSLYFDLPDPTVCKDN